jgi:GT2 family glycosyltransferase
MMPDRCVDLMYLACNRLEFTQESFTALLANTDWRLVRELFVYDDGSADGTAEWLRSRYRRCPAPSRMVETKLGSPVSFLNDFIRRARAPVLAKSDNDAMLPPGWLRSSIAVLERHPELHMLGIEAMYAHVDSPDLPRSYRRAEFVSGLGLYRRSVFFRSRPSSVGKWFGFEEWQRSRRGSLVCGWIDPAIPVFLLDRFPFDPWRYWSQSYVQRGWQRAWPPYDPTCTLWNWRWPSPPFSAADPRQSRLGYRVVIMSARASNLIPCIKSLLTNEPDLMPEDIIVVDDGARPQAEACLPGVRWIDGARPFVFARNANIGLAAASGSDVILLNDDARLVTPRGLSLMAATARVTSRIGICSAAIRGVVGNPNQKPSRRGMRFEARTLAFVCVFLPRTVITQVGLFDERFTGYGYEDDDYCLRVRNLGLRLGIFDSCVVDHSGVLPSTFRTRTDVSRLIDLNRKLYYEKYGV